MFHIIVSKLYKTAINPVPVPASLITLEFSVMKFGYELVKMVHSIVNEQQHQIYCLKFLNVVYAIEYIILDGYTLSFHRVGPGSISIPVATALGINVRINSLGNKMTDRLG